LSFVAYEIFVNIFVVCFLCPRRTIPNDPTDRGIFTLAKQCHGIDFCDCDEFGIVI